MVLQWIMGYIWLFQFWFPQGICPVVRLLGQIIILLLVFKEIFILFSIVTVSICITNDYARGFPFLHILSSIYCLQIFWRRPFWLVWGDSSYNRMCVLKSLQSCPTLCKPINCSLLGSSVHGILQARILEWGQCPSPGDLIFPTQGSKLNLSYLLHWQAVSLPPAGSSLGSPIQ